MLVDVHAHLDHELFSPDLPAVIERAKKAGVVTIITNGVNPTSNTKVLELAKQYDIIKPSFGLYPTDLLGFADESGMPRHPTPINIDDEFDFFLKHKQEFISIGEVGIDYKWDQQHHDLQKKNFQKIIDFAEKAKKPLIIHSRKAEKDVIDILESSTVKRAVLHCFMGNKNLIKRAADWGFFFSVPVLILRLQHFQMLVEEVSITQLLTETDCPWLSPYPDKKNEPAFVAETIKKIATIKKMNEDEVIKNIFATYQKIFLFQ